MSTGRGTGSRLSRKKKIGESSQCHVETAIHDITDDFEDVATVFRVPVAKKVKVEASSLARPRGRPKKITLGKSSLSRVDSRKSVDDDDDFCDVTSNASTNGDSQDVVVLEGNDFLSELEESISSETEKLCVSCKHIVPTAIFSEHFKGCLQKFRLLKRETRSTPLISKPQEYGISEEKGSKPAQEKECGPGSKAVEEKENQHILPCPLCLKPLKNKSQRQAHLKSCAVTRGVSSEKLLLAVRLQEKQLEERLQLGLPLITPQNQEDKTNAVERTKRKCTTGAARSKDPDLALAIALSRSMAEEEAEERASREEQLLALGLDKIVEEDRITKPVVLLPPTTGAQKGGRAQEKNRGRKGRRNFRNTVLSTRSAEERERIISEKVASILTAEDPSQVTREERSTKGGRGRLAKFQGEHCQLWDIAHSQLERPLEEFYVATLEQYIQPKRAEVGRLLKSVTDIPGRLNVTVLHAMDENSDTGSDEEEESIVEGYCTQLAMADLLGSQEMDVTVSRKSMVSVDLSGIQDLEDPPSGPNVTLEAASGFWLVHHTPDRNVDLDGRRRGNGVELTFNEKNGTAVSVETCTTEGKMSSVAVSMDDADGKDYSDRNERYDVGSKLVLHCDRTSDSDKETGVYVSNSQSCSETQIITPQKTCNEFSNTSKTLVANTQGSECMTNELTKEYENERTLCRGVKELAPKVSDKLVKFQKQNYMEDNTIEDHVDDSDNTKFCVSSEVTHDISGGTCKNKAVNADLYIECVLDTSKDFKIHESGTVSKKSGSFPSKKYVCLKQDDVDSDDSEGGSDVSSISNDSDQTLVFETDSKNTNIPKRSDMTNNDRMLLHRVKGFKSTDVGKGENSVRKETDASSRVVCQDSKRKVKKLDALQADVPVVGTCESSSLKMVGVSITDSESDEEGGAKTILYDDDASREMLSSPLRGFANKSATVEPADNLDSTIHFSDLECFSDHSLVGSRNSTNPAKDNLLDNTVPYHYENGNDFGAGKGHSNCTDLSVCDQNSGKLNDNGHHHNNSEMEETIPFAEGSKKSSDNILDNGVKEFKGGSLQVTQKTSDEIIPGQYKSASRETLNSKDVHEIDAKINDKVVHKVHGDHASRGDGSDDLASDDELDETILHESAKVSLSLRTKSHVVRAGESIDTNLTIIQQNASVVDKARIYQNVGDSEICVPHCKDKNLSESPTSVKVKLKDNPSMTHDTSDQLNMKTNPLVTLSMKKSDEKKNEGSRKGAVSFHEKLIYDWSSLLASGEGSDVTITVMHEEEVSAHLVVLLARCPQLYREVMEYEKRISWKEVSYEGAYVFLVFLYTGECSVKTKDDALWMDVFDLALKYNCEDLVAYLESLYKAGNTPKKNNNIPVQINLELEVTVPESLQTSSKSVIKTAKNALEISTVKSSNLMPRHTSTEIKRASENCDYSSLSTPKRRIYEKYERIAKRRLSLSPINRKSDVAPQVEQSEVRNLQLINDTEMDATSKETHGSQSPDLFDTSHSMEDVSYITTPSKSTLLISSPNKCHLVESLKKNASPAIDDEETVNELAPQECCGSDNRQISKFGAQDQESPMSKVSLDSQKWNNQTLNEIGTEHQSYQNIKDTASDKEMNSVTCRDEEKESEEDTDEVIDLTCDSSDNSPCTDVTAENVDNDEDIGLAKNANRNSLDDMEPLRLQGDSEASLECDNEAESPIVNVKETCNKGSESESTKNFEVDITCPSPKSAVSLQEDLRSDGEEEGHQSYISNVWDDFDEVGCDVPVILPETPAKQTVDNSDLDGDLPSVEKRNANSQGGTDKNRVDGDICELSPKSCLIPSSSWTQSVELQNSKSTVAHDFATEKSVDVNVSDVEAKPTSPLSDLPSFNSDEGQQKIVAHETNPEKASPTGSGIGDNTMVKLREDFDDSAIWRDEFDPVFEDQKLLDKDTRTSKKNNPCNHFNTPQHKPSTSKKKTVTPMPEYKEMASPELKKELEKYGIKPISRRKAVVLLEHVYEKTHPLVTDSEADSSFCDSPQRQPSHKKSGNSEAANSGLHKRVISNNQKKSAKETGFVSKKAPAARKANSKTKPAALDACLEEQETTEVDDGPLNSSQSSISSEGSELDCFEESMLAGVGDDDIATSATQQGSFTSQVTQFILSDPDLHQKILLYEPFFVEDLQASLKANGVKSNMKNLIDFLDNQCITFRTHQGQRNRVRKRKCKRKGSSTPGASPKKARKNNST